MARRDQVLARLGDAGLKEALLATLDHSALVRLANGCGASVRGMRNQTLGADRLAQAISERARRDAGAGTRVLRTLSRQNRDFLAAYAALPPDAARARLADAMSRPDPDAGRLLFALAREPRDGMEDEEILAAGEVLAQARRAEGDEVRTLPKRAAKVTSARAEVRILRRENAELTGRLGLLEARLAKSQERVERLRKELAETRLELGNLRLEARRSRSEQSRAEREIESLGSRLEEALGRKEKDRTSEVLQLLRESRKKGDRLSRSLDKLLKGETSRLRDELSQTRDALAREMASQAKGTRDRAEQVATAVVSVRQEMADLRKSLEERTPARRQPARGERERVGLYVDVQNVYYAAREKASRLDFSKLLEQASRTRRLVRAVAYVVESKEADQSAFINLLQSHSFEVKRKPLKVRADGSMKGNWDLEIALDVLDDADGLDVVVLVTGDGDFVSLVQELKRRGPLVEVYSFPPSTAQELREAADRFVAITRKMLLPLPPERSGGRARRSRTKRAETGGKTKGS